MGDYYGGGGIYVNHTNANIVNCTFHGNTTSQRGGAMHFRGNKDVNVKNCIIFDNYPEQIYRRMTTGSVTVSYSNIQGGYSGSGNLNSDPCFPDPRNDDFHLESQAGRWDPFNQSWVYDSISSPCIDMGSPHSVWTIELWPHGKRTNMGAYGGMPEASMSLSDAGNIADLNNDGQVDYLDLKVFGEEWAAEHVLLSQDLDRNAAVNLRDFAVFGGNWRWQE